MAHSAASKPLPAKWAVEAASFSRQASCVNGVRENPTTRVCSGSRFLRYNSYNAGISLRLVRSPDAPKMTIVWGMVGPRGSQGSRGV